MTSTSVNKDVKFVKCKNIRVYLLCWLFCVQHLYLKQVGKWVFYILTAGGFGLWALYDLITAKAKIVKYNALVRDLETNNSSGGGINQATIYSRDDLNNSLGRIGINQVTYYYKDELPNEFIVLDIETTGLEPGNSEIIEISILKYVNGLRIESLNTLIKPNYKISDHITKINGITNEMVRNAPRLHEVISKIHLYLSGTNYIVGYNVSFDLRFVSTAFSEHKKYIENINAIDVLQIVRNHVHNSSNHKLETMKNHFNIKKISHRAEADCEVTVEVWKKCIEEVNNRELLIINKMEETFLTMNDNERQFIASLKAQLGEFEGKLRFNVMSDKTINFSVGHQIGRVKLSGRKFKMQIINKDNVIWLDISDLSEATNNIKHWVKYVKTLSKIG